MELAGKNVFKITSENELEEKYNKMITTNFSISASPYYKINTEYRAIIVNDKVKLIYGKVRPIVTGNGKNTIKELLIKFNKNFFLNE